MATPILFTKVTEWQDYTDPTNVPPEIRVISANDLLRYENAIAALVDRSNSHETLLETVTSDLSTVSQQITAVEQVNDGQGSTIAGLSATVTGQAQQITALTRPMLVRSLTTAYTVATANRIHIHTGGSATYTIPAANTAAGLDLVFHNKGTGTLTLSSPATELWANGGGFNTKSVLSNETVWMVSDGTNWVLLTTDSNATT